MPTINVNGKEMEVDMDVLRCILHAADEHLSRLAIKDKLVHSEVAAVSVIAELQFTHKELL